MNAAVTSATLGDPAVVLDRHAIGRATGIPTVSLLVGPIGASGGTWRRWAAGTGRTVVVANQKMFPYAECVCSVAESSGLPAAEVHCLAKRADRDPNERFANKGLGSCTGGASSRCDSWPITSFRG